MKKDYCEGRLAGYNTALTLLNRIDLAGSDCILNIIKDFINIKNEFFINMLSEPSYSKFNEFLKSINEDIKQKDHSLEYKINGTIDALRDVIDFMDTYTERLEEIKPLKDFYLYVNHEFLSLTNKLKLN